MKCAIKDCENQVSLLCLSCHALISGEGLPSQAYQNSRRMIETALIKQLEQEPVKLSWADIGVTSLPLASLEQEPVAWVQPNGEIVVRTDYGGRLYYSEQNVYTAPPKKEWVGLTDNEARRFYEKYTNREELIYAIDKFLEEKNNG